jgi:hypothetical protein
VQVKAIACEFPNRRGVLSRWSVAELGAHIRACGLTASLSDTTIWRWLSEDAIRPWQHRCWIFPRDPHFEAKAGRILDLYQRIWKGRKLGPNEFVLSADEKTSIQARSRKAQSLPTQSHRPMKIEHEYKRLGASGPISPPWTSTVQNSSAAAKPKVERCPLTVSWIK